MIKKLFIAAAMLPLAACSATSIAQQTQRLRQADQALKIGAGAVATVAPKDVEAAPESVTLANAEPISGEAIFAPVKRVRGKASSLTAKPRIAVAGYNIAAIVQSRAVASTSGGFTRNSARTSMTMRLAGVDDALLQEIADAAYADLVTQFAAAGIDIVPLSEISAAEGAAKLFAGEPAFNGDLKRGNGDGKVRVAGVSATGATSYSALGRTTFNGNAIAKPSGALDAIMVFPNLCLGFAETSGSGNRMFASKAHVEGEAEFMIDEASKAEIAYSSGRFLDGWATLQLKENVSAPEQFATVAKTGSRNNALAVGLSSALGSNMGSSSSSEYTVTADPERYRALALKAAKGFNASLVAEFKAARNGA